MENESLFGGCEFVPDGLGESEFILNAITSHLILLKQIKNYMLLQVTHKGQQPECLERLSQVYRLKKLNSKN